MRKINLTLFLILLSVGANRIPQNDPIFKLKPTLTSKPSISNTNDDRKLGVLDWFSSDPEKEASKAREKNVKDMMELLQLADGFRENQNFEVEVSINYKSSDEKATDASNDNRVLAQKPTEMSRMAAGVRGNDKANILKQKQFQIPKNFFRVL
mgnify:CR=1 FL=1